MFKRIRNFIYNRRGKILIGGIFLSIFFTVARYTRNKLIEWQEKEQNELIEKSRRRQHFEDTKSTCKQTMLMLSGSLRTKVNKCLNCKQIVSDLSRGTANKISAWNKLKVLVIAKTVTIIYSYTMIVITLRIQFSVLAGSMYKNKFLNNSKSVEKLAEKVNKNYLSLSKYLINNGVLKLSFLIQQEVENVTSNYSLGQQLNLRDVEKIYWTIMSSVSSEKNKDPVKNFISYIIASDFLTTNDTDKTFTKLVDDTVDLLKSQKVQDLMQVNLRNGFNLLIDRISEYFSQNGKSDNKAFDEETFVNLNSITMSIVKLIPIFNGQVPENPTDGDLPSDWLQKLLVNKEIEILGQEIYEQIIAS
jgi:peroxin-3